MLTLILVTAMGGIIGYYLSKKNDTDYGTKVFNIFVGLLLGLVAASFIAITIGKTMPTVEQTDRVELANVSSNSTISGKFYLGSGRISEVMHYHYFYEDNGGYRYDKLSVEDDVMIFEEDREDAYLLTKKNECINTFSWFGVCKNRDSSSYEFHIPEGGILKEYSLN